MRDQAGNLQPALDIFPDNPAPVVRKGADGERELVRLRWGMPTPPERMKGNADRGTTNIRHPMASKCPFAPSLSDLVD